MEVMAGVPDTDTDTRQALNECLYLPQRGITDAIEAAAMYRTCRRRGETPRRLTDCLIGAVAIRNAMPVLHRDRDYDVLARHAGVAVTAT